MRMRMRIRIRIQIQGEGSGGRRGVEREARFHGHPSGMRRAIVFLFFFGDGARVGGSSGSSSSSNLRVYQQRPLPKCPDRARSFTILFYVLFLCLSDRILSINDFPLELSAVEGCPAHLQGLHAILCRSSFRSGQVRSVQFSS